MSEYGEFRNLYSGEETNDKMNEWKEKTASPADTYIEWVFESKCRQLSEGFRIITEWRKRKLQYVALMKTIAIDFQHYSRHDVTHSICILQIVCQLLGKRRVDSLSAGDLWLLLEAAYSHDIGMALTYEQMVELWEKDEEFQRFVRRCIVEDTGDVSNAALYYKEMDNLLHERRKMEDLDGKEEFSFSKDWPVVSQNYIHILVAEYIRTKHAARVEKLFQQMDKESDTIIPIRLYRIVTLVTKMHGQDFEDILKSLKYCTNGFGSGVLHPQFVAAMIRIGDLLDIDNNRFDPYALRHFGRLPYTSMLHMEKHTAITHICVSESEITAEAKTENYDVAKLTDGWFRNIREEVNNLICVWNEIVPEALKGCTLKKSDCKVFLNQQRFDSDMRKEFSINKDKIINLLVGVNIYNDPLDFIREYLQNAMDASKMQLWMDLKGGKYEFQRNRRVLDYCQMTPFDLDSSVYNNYTISILVSWNDENNKVIVKFVDQGIGIEKEYFKKLSNIGTGWRGREKYNEELQHMVDWLKPTGGFGIGVQSAFMVTDSVEIITKSDKDSQAYKVRLESPNKGGTISVEDYPDLFQHGTTITFELEPEKFQGWMERQRKIDEKRYRLIDKEYSYEYDFGKWDEFDPDGILPYIQKFFENYISTNIPNPLFPIEIRSTVADGIFYRNEYWTNVNYWEHIESDLIERWEYDEKQYLGIYVNKPGSTYFLVWNETDCILTRIAKAGKDKFVCYKNVLVPETDNTLLNLFSKYSICIDFMGFPVDNCLRLHRASFLEKFPWDKYCYAAFRMYIHFLWKCSEQREKNIAENLKKGSIQSEADAMAHDNIIAEWMSYPAQMIRMIAFYDMIDEPYQILEKKIKVDMRKYKFTNNKEQEESPKLIIDYEDTLIDGVEVINVLQKWFESINHTTGRLCDDKEIPVVALISGEEYIKNESDNMTVSPSGIKEWIDTKKITQDNGELKASVLDLLGGEFGLITDKDTIRMLLSDRRFYTKRFTINGEDFFSVTLYILAYGEDHHVNKEKPLYDHLWEESAAGRRYATGENTDQYPQLKIKELPFRCKNNRYDEVYLLSPISNYRIKNIKEMIDKDRRLSYDDFRELVWGKKGNEQPEYQMLIDWVVKHQIEEKRYTRDKIIETYEKFLHDIYREKVCEPKKSEESESKLS